MQIIILLSAVLIITGLLFLYKKRKIQAVEYPRINLKGGYNFRDMGGIKTKDGRVLKKGKIIRADELNRLTKRDLKLLSQIPLEGIIDFRSEEEMQASPDKIPASVNNVYKLSINPGNVVSADFASIENITAAEAAAFMKNIYIAFVTDPQTINRFKEFFAILQKEMDGAVLFHCTAGKDRTGTAAALFLYALGIDEKEIMRDYNLSNIYLETKYAPLKTKNPALKYFFEVQPQYLNEALDIAKKKYGSVENYLTQKLGVDLKKMRDIYLD